MSELPRCDPSVPLSSVKRSVGLDLSDNAIPASLVSLFAWTDCVCWMFGWLINARLTSRGTPLTFRIKISLPACHGSARRIFVWDWWVFSSKDVKRCVNLCWFSESSMMLNYKLFKYVSLSFGKLWWADCCLTFDKPNNSLISQEKWSLQPYIVIMICLWYNALHRTPTLMKTTHSWTEHQVIPTIKCM